MIQQSINLKKTHNKKWFLSRQFLIIVISVVVTSVGIKAADKISSSAPKISGNGLCPEDMVQVLAAKGNFCIDKYEASVGEECAHKSPGSEIDSRENLDNNSCAPISASGLTPWRYISQNQASLACARAGKRLPTNQEWQQAALGTADISDNWSADDCQVANNWSAQPGPTGSGSRCVSASGAFDMVGNLWEWTDGTVYEGKFNEKILPDQGYVKAINQDALPSETGLAGDESYYNDYLYLKKNGTRAIARGGYWNNKEQAGVYSAYIVSLPSYAEAGIGFRCVK